MTGALKITNALCATGIVSGSTVFGGTCVYSPITCGSTCVVSPVVCGSTCAISPIVFASTCSCSPIVCVSTCYVQMERRDWLVQQLQHPQLI
jgi:hypothetical protein